FLTRAAAAQARSVAPFMVRRPARVIYEAVDAERFRPDAAGGRAFRERHGLGDRPFLLAVGALEREKRYDWLLDALARLGPQGPRSAKCWATPASSPPTIRSSTRWRSPSCSPIRRAAVRSAARRGGGRSSCSRSSGWAGSTPRRSRMPKTLADGRRLQGRRRNG